MRQWNHWLLIEITSLNQLYSSTTYTWDSVCKVELVVSIIVDGVRETLLQPTIGKWVSIYTLSNLICQTRVFLLLAITLLWPLFGQKVPDQLFSQRCRDAEWLEASAFFPGDALGKRRIARGFSAPLGARGPHKLWNWHLSSITFAK